MSEPTLIFIRHGKIGSRHFSFGDELPRGLLSREVIDQWLDQRWLFECDVADRRSLYRLFAPFSGAKEKEEPSRGEKENLCL